MTRKHIMRLAVVLLVALPLVLAGCAKPNTTDDVPTLEEPLEQIPTAAERQVSLRSTVLYYQDDNGYLVPVMRRLPWAEGIAKASLECLVSGGDNDVEAARLGLRTILPEGTTIELDIKDSVARVDLPKAALQAEDALEESTRVSAMVYTLTEYPSVQQVQFLVDGQYVKTLKHGTSLENPIARGDINMEGVPDGVSVTGARKVELYFQSDASETLVPVTRLVFSPSDVTTAVVELLKGPKKDSGLSTTMPGQAALVSVTNKDGIVTINFTKEFKDVAEATDGGQTALKALVLTCAQFPDVKEVRVLVDGKEYDPGAATLAIPTFVNIEDEAWGLDLDSVTPVTAPQG